jgi:exopolyphosphatase/guanosine-5'-triphosphate,3'-diphosphate pyrophosphatase
MSTETAESRIRPATAGRPAAVIDVGATSIRMAIAEIDDQGGVRPITTLSQAVSLGKDTFTRGSIEKSTIEDCVRVFKSYRRLLAEYQIERPEQLRAVATSAVREAQNRLSFLDRIYTATGIPITVIDESEVNRVTYLGVQPLLKSDPVLAKSRTAIIEVGGGSTELLLVQNADVIFSHSYRLGSLRLREQLETLHASRTATRAMMETHIRRVIDQILQQVPPEMAEKMVTMGGDMRFAARELIPEWRPHQVVGLPVARLEQLADRILGLTEDQLVHRYHITFPEAGTLGPALLAYAMLARAFELEEVIVCDVNLRDGLLTEMATRGAWNEDFANQVLRSAVDLGRKFDFHEVHARHVTKLCKILFQGLRDEHQLPPRYELLLMTAAMLHEIGMYVSVGSYHKHTMYLIDNSELFGLSRMDERLVALTARYHRKTSPKPTHTIFTALDRDQRIAVVKMAAMLRLADSLDAGHGQRLHELQFSKEGGRLVISIPNVEDLSLEQLALKQTGTLFEETYGMPVLLRRLRM